MACALALLLIAGPGSAQTPPVTLEPIPGDPLTVIAELRARGPELPPETQDALLNALRRQDAYAAHGQDQQHLIKHEMMTYLRRSRIDKDLLVDVLGIIAHNPNQHLVLRDYALQHAYLVVDAGAATERGIALLTDALAWHDSSLAGTALRGLTRLVQSGRVDVSGALVAEAASTIVTNAACAASARSVAVQSLGNLRVEEALPAIRELAATGTPIFLRVAAIQALGAFQHEEDRALMEQLSNERGIHVLAARKALAAWGTRQ
jgi:hypothetical protein